MLAMTPGVPAAPEHAGSPAGEVGAYRGARAALQARDRVQLAGGRAWLVRARLDRPGPGGAGYRRRGGSGGTAERQETPAPALLRPRGWPGASAEIDPWSLPLGCLRPQQRHPFRVITLREWRHNGIFQRGNSRPIAVLPGRLTGRYVRHHWYRPDPAGFGVRADAGFAGVSRRLTAAAVVCRFAVVANNPSARGGSSADCERGCGDRVRGVEYSLWRFSSSAAPRGWGVRSPGRALAAGTW